MLGFGVPAAESTEKQLKIGGVGSSLGTMKLLTAAFEKKHPGVECTVLSSLGTSGSIRAVAKGAIDIGIGGRPMNVEEMGLGLHIINYAATPLVFVTKEDTRKTDLSRDELVRILAGELQTWPDGQRIRMILRPATDSESILLKTVSPEIGKALDNAKAHKFMQVALTSQECADSAEKIPGSLTYSTLTLIKSEKRKLKILSFNGITPDLKTIADGSYPFAERLYLITKDKPSGIVKQFVDFVLGADGKKILKQTGNLVTAK
jgi:phosphate transport system substrate-binding protein